MGEWFHNPKTVKFVLIEGLPLRDEHNPDWPWFKVMGTNFSNQYRIANPANLEELKEWARKMEGDDVEIIVEYQ